MEITEDQLKRFEGDVKSMSGGDRIIDISFETLKAFSITVATELGALRIAYAYQGLAVSVKEAPNVGGWYVGIRNES